MRRDYTMQEGVRLCVGQPPPPPYPICKHPEDFLRGVYKKEQKTSNPRLGVEDSNLGKQIQSLLSYR
jgi:hypothetical protein